MRNMLVICSICSWYAQYAYFARTLEEIIRVSTFTNQNNFCRPYPAFIPCRSW